MEYDSFDTKFDSHIDEDETVTDSLSIQSSDTDLTMDMLPDWTRFTQYLSFNELIDRNIDIGLEDSVENFYGVEKITHEVTVYVQSNSRLKLVLFISSEKNKILNLDTLIKDVSGI